MKHPLTTVVGSYPVPTWLKFFSTRESLRDAIMAVLKTQELAGLDVITDGELARWDVNHPETNGMIDYFIRSMDGIRTRLSRRELERYREEHHLTYRQEPAGMVTAPLSAGTLNLERDFRTVRELTRSRLKFTLTSPYMLARVLLDDYYRDLETLVLEIAGILAEQIEAIDADVIQVDEANVTGHPDDGRLAAEAINRILHKVRHQKAVHLCYGNYGGQTIQKGTYEKLIEFMNALQCDHLVLEVARRPEDELYRLREIRKEIGLGIGVIDIKDNQVESPDTVARRIEKAATVLGAERIHYVHPDCGLWMLSRSVADAKLKSLVAGRDLFLGLAQ